MPYFIVNVLFKSKGSINMLDVYVNVKLDQFIRKVRDFLRK